MYFVNTIVEFLGVHLTGFGVGNVAAGFAIDQGIGGLTTANGPLWFMSGIFVCGYIIYYLLAKYGDHFVGWIAPIIMIFYYGSTHLTNRMPMWNVYFNIGDFSLPFGLLHMFCGMSLGVIFWVVCDNLKGKRFSTGMIWLLTIIQLGAVFFTIAIKSWNSAHTEIGQMFHVGWGVNFTLSAIFTLLVLLNVDHVTRFPLFSTKLWRLPGRLAMYVYMVHYPIIIFIVRALGYRRGAADGFVENVFWIFLLCSAVSIVVGYILYKIQNNVLLPWFNTQPWFKKEQTE
jgi:hypothetical protein